MSQETFEDLLRSMNGAFGVRFVGKMPEGMMAGDALFQDFFKHPEIKGLTAKLVGKKAELDEMEKGYKEMYQLAQDLVEQAREREAQFQASLDNSEGMVGRLVEKNQMLSAKVDYLNALLRDTAQAGEALSQRLTLVEASLIDSSDILNQIKAVCQAVTEKEGGKFSKGEFVKAIGVIVEIISQFEGNGNGNDADKEGSTVIPVADEQGASEVERQRLATEIGGAHL